MFRYLPYADSLREKKLWPVDPTREQNWSGRGQHAVFQKHERKLLNDILELHDTLGTTATAKVESVKCRRILLARKTIVCRGGMTKEKVLNEVAHLDRLNHAHIVRVIGTYVFGAELAILLYPVADWHLEGFLGLMNDECPTDYSRSMAAACRDFFVCLSNAVHFMHENLTKHMDIKPQNILVKRRRRPRSEDAADQMHAYTVLIADFGISRSYDSMEAAETDGITSFTRRYAAPEVIKQEARGLPADIFSLGCVFLEMYLCLVDGELQPDLLSLHSRADKCADGVNAILKSNLGNDASYQANLCRLSDYLMYYDLIDHELSSPPGPRSWLRSVILKVRELVPRMIQEQPKHRPTAADLRNAFGIGANCCDGGPYDLEVDVDDRY